MLNRRKAKLNTSWQFHLIYNIYEGLYIEAFRSLQRFISMFFYFLYKCSALFVQKFRCFVQIFWFFVQRLRNISGCFLKTSAWILLNMAYTGKWLVSNSVDFRWDYVIFGVCFVCFVITDCQNVRRLWKKKKFSFWHAICFNYGVMLRYYRVNLNKNK